LEILLHSLPERMLIIVAVSADSDVVIVTAGVAQKPGESRLSLLERNAEIMSHVIPEVLKYSPRATICIASNPCDIMAAVAAKLAGPTVAAGRVFGSGTCLDTSRLQSLIGNMLDIDAQNVHGYVVGEHGDSSVALWSSVRVGGASYYETPWTQGDAAAVQAAMHKHIVDSAYEVIEKKGYTNWAIGMTGAYLCKAVMRDERRITTVSTCVRGIHGIEHDVFLSMPCTVGASGVRRVVNVPMTEHEIEQFKRTAESIWTVQQGIWDKI
jgi:L-lactate dehydrogenase